MITVKMDMIGIPRLPRLSAEEMGEMAQDAARGVRVVAKNFDRLNARSSNSSFWGDAANSRSPASCPSRDAVGVQALAGLPTNTLMPYSTPQVKS